MATALPHPVPPPNRQRTARAALTFGGAEITARVLTTLLTVVAARMLEPSAVGLLGLATIIVGLVSMVGFYPEGAAVVAGGATGHAGYACIGLALRSAVALTLGLAVWLQAPAIAGHLAADAQGIVGLTALLAVLLWVPVVEGLAAYPQVWLQRTLDLGYLARLQFAQPVMFVGLAIGLLALGHGYLGVAWAQLASTVVAAALAWLRVITARGAAWPGWPPRGAWVEVAGGSGRMFVGGFGGFLGERLDNLLVSATLGHTLMSFYSLAWNATRAPMSTVARAVRSVVVPTVARIREEPRRLERALRDSIRFSHLVVAPGLVVLFLSASTLTTMVLGAKWLPVVPPLRIMCLSALVAPLLFTAGALLVGLGRAHLVGASTVVHLALQFLVIPPAARRWGLVGAAFSDAAIITASTAVVVATAIWAAPGLRWIPVRSLLLTTAAALAAGLSAWMVVPPAATGAAGDAGRVVVALLAYPAALLAVGEGPVLKELWGLRRQTSPR
jgi:O-antigen/teichoic acid export membrane protein